MFYKGNNPGPDEIEKKFTFNGGVK